MAQDLVGQNLFFYTPELGSQNPDDITVAKNGVKIFEPNELPDKSTKKGSLQPSRPTWLRAMDQVRNCFIFNYAHIPTFQKL